MHKHIFQILFALILVLSASATAKDQATASVKKEKAIKGVTAVKMPAVLQDVKRILCYGDSLTDGSSYPDFVVNSLNALFPDAGFVLENSAKCGDNTRDLLRRFDADVLPKKPDLITICIGTNDCNQKIPVEEYEANLNKLVKMAADANIRLALLLPSPLTKEESKTRFQGYLEAIRKTAKTHSLTLINAHDLFLAWQKNGKEVMGPDGIHHGPDGFACMARAVLNGFGLTEAPLLQVITPWPNALTDWEVSATVVRTKETAKTFFALTNANGWKAYDTQSMQSKVAWYDKPFLQRGGVLPFAEGNPQKGFAFCRTTYSADKEQNAELQIGGSPPMYVYCNGALVWEQTGAHGYHPNADRVEVSLKKGKNEFVVCSNYLVYLNLVPGK